MDLETLRKKLHDTNVPERWYSINDGLKPDACIIIKNYFIWECFYYGERGDKLDYISAGEDESAYQWLWEKMESQLKTFKILPKETENR